MTVRRTVVVCVLPPPVPVMVMVPEPVPELGLTVTVIVEVPEPGAAMGVGVKVTVMLDGKPFADRAIAALKPFRAVVVIVEAPEPPTFTVSAVGDALRVKSAAGGVVTVRVTVVDWVTPPPVPVTVIEYVPGVVVEATARVRVEVPAPGAAMDVGLKLTVTPLGWPLADKAIAESKPLKTAVVIVAVPLLPGATESEVGEAEMLKFGVVAAPTSALIRPAPFGLPQPVAKS